METEERLREQDHSREEHLREDTRSREQGHRVVILREELLRVTDTHKETDTLRDMVTHRVTDIHREEHLREDTRSREGDHRVVISRADILREEDLPHPDVEERKIIKRL